MSPQHSVVLIPSPLQGHITPMLQLGSILESNGFSIVVAHTLYNAPNPLNHSTFTFLPLPDGIDHSDKSTTNLRNILGAININCKSPLHDFLVPMVQNVACIIYDTNMHFVDDVAKSLQLPTIVMCPYSCAASRAQDLVIELWSKNCLPLPECQMGETVPNLHPFKFKDMPFPLANDIPVERFEFLKVSLNTGSSCAIIWNTMDELEHAQLSFVRKDSQLPIFSIGPFHKITPSIKTSFIEEDNNCIRWLDKQPPNSVLYVSLGSVVTIDENELLETAFGLVKSDQPFIWVIRENGGLNGTNFNSQLLSVVHKISEGRGFIVNWAPQKKVLGHSAVGGFWSHSGWNSTLESISEGVPMICRPDFYDQWINARYVTDVWKVGLEMVRPVDRENVEKIVTRLMTNVEGSDMRKRAYDMKHKFQECVMEGGSSFRSLKELTHFISTLPKLARSPFITK